MKLIAFGFGLAFGVAGWKNAAPAVQPNGHAAVLLVCGAILLAYLAGRSRRSPAAVAIATAEAHAQAVAQNVVQVAIVSPHAQSERARVAPGWDEMPWQVVTGSPREQLPVSDEFDAFDPVEVLDAIADDRVQQLREVDEA